MAKADFYLGRGPGAQWLGSVVDYGSPADVASENLFREARGNYTEDSYLERVRQIMLDANQDAHWPRSPWATQRTWPHEHATSADTDYAYAYTKNAVWVFRQGHLLAIHHPNGASAVEHFPIMEGVPQ
jgi:hypothetical protein